VSGYEPQGGMLAPVDPGRVAIHVGRKPQIDSNEEQRE